MAGQDIIMIRQKELKRLYEIHKVLNGEITQVKALEMLSLSERQIRRICRLSRHLTPFPQIEMPPFFLANLLQFISQSVAAAGDIEDTCMMHKSVYNRRGYNIILKDLTPIHLVNK